MEGRPAAERDRQQLREIDKPLAWPKRQEVLERLRAKPVPRLSRSAAAVLRAERAGR